MWGSRPAPWLRLRTWLFTRLGLWRGRWQRAELSAQVARWTWWPWPWSQRAWTYATYHPAGLADDQAAPLVVLLHGCRQKAMPFAQASGWVQAADRARFRLLCPEQRRGANPWGCWNWFHPPAQTGQGELDVVLRALALTRERVACTGICVVGLSSGGGLAALLAFHHAKLFDAVAAVAAPPLLGRASLQDPRQVMRHGLALSPTITTLGLQRCAPLLVLHGADDEVVTPLCAQQLTDQARQVLEREHGALTEHRSAQGVDWLATGRLLLRHRLLPGLGHAWTGGPGGHAYVFQRGPALTQLVLEFFREGAALRPGG